MHTFAQLGPVIIRLQGEFQIQFMMRSGHKCGASIFTLIWMLIIYFAYQGLRFSYLFTLANDGYQFYTVYPLRHIGLAVFLVLWDIFEFVYPHTQHQKLHLP